MAQYRCRRLPGGLDEGLQLFRQLGRNDGDARSRLAQQIHLAQRDAPATDDDSRLALQPYEYGQVIHGEAPENQLCPTADRTRGCNPHSRDSGRSHHQRPARGASPGWIARVQGWQPMLGYCLSCSML